MSQFKYCFVAARQDFAGQGDLKVWYVAVVDGKKHPIFGDSLVEYSNKLGQEAWELVSDSVNGSSRELVFKQTAR